MKTRLLKSILNTGYQITNEGDFLGINSPYITGIIRINKDTKVISSNDYPNRFTNEELKRIWEQLHIIEPEVLEDILTGDDVIESSINIYSIKDGKLICEQTDIPEWPNVTSSGIAIYQNTHFLTEREALEDGVKEELCWVKLIDNNIKEIKGDLKKKMENRIKHESWHKELVKQLKTLKENETPFLNHQT